MFAQTDQTLATNYWHWFFLIQPTPFPEDVILASPQLFASRFFGGGYAGEGANFWNPDALKVYVEQLSVKETVVGMCEDYRAATTVDLAEQKRDLEEGRRVQCDLRVLWGGKGVIGKYFDAMKEWRDVSDGEVSGEQVDSGHYIPEEVPDDLLRNVREFFG